MKWMMRRAKYTWRGYESNEYILSQIKINPPVPGRSPAEIVGSNPTGVHGYLSVMCCKVEVSATS